MQRAGIRRASGTSDLATRGRGRASGKGRNQRTVHNILPDSQLADSLLVVEVYTNEGDTSSGPRTSTIRQLKAGDLSGRDVLSPFQSTSGILLTARLHRRSQLDECMAVYNRDVVKVPKGYHPVATIAGYDNYYLNVMAGPLRKWRFTGKRTTRGLTHQTTRDNTSLSGTCQPSSAAGFLSMENPS